MNCNSLIISVWLFNQRNIGLDFSATSVILLKVFALYISTRHHLDQIILASVLTALTRQNFEKATKCHYSNKTCSCLVMLQSGSTRLEKAKINNILFKNVPIWYCCDMVALKSNFSQSYQLCTSCKQKMLISFQVKCNFWT